MQESGLKGYLRHDFNGAMNTFSEAGFQEEEARELISAAYNQIHGRMLNPLEVREEDLDIQFRRVENWILSHYPAYSSVKH